MKRIKYILAILVVFGGPLIGLGCRRPERVETSEHEQEIGRTVEPEITGD